MAEIKAPYRYDVVGSFLRPKKLKEARELFTGKNFKGTADYC